ncbi:MAG: energy transducer TonB [bacterium]|nr:energy transducer TonB [bacterium]
MSRRPLRQPPPRSFTTAAQEQFRRGGRRRWLAAVALAVGTLLLLAWLGPREPTIVRQLTYYGAPGELKIMPEVSIDDGADQAHRLPRSLQAPPPTPIEVVPERTRERAAETVPVPAAGTDRMQPVVADPADAVIDALFDESVQLLLPQQTSPDWYILRLVRPEYPVLASEQDRRRPVINVVVWIFVDPQGDVTAAQLVSNDGGDVFAQAVLEAVQQWKLGWRVDPQKGRQLVLPWRFTSPYQSGARHPPGAGSG